MSHKIILKLLSFLFLFCLSSCAASRLSYFDTRNDCEASETQSLVLYKKPYVVTHYEKCDGLVTVVYSDENNKYKNETGRRLAHNAIYAFVSFYEEDTKKQVTYEFIETIQVIISPKQGLEQLGAKKAFVSFFRMQKL